MGGSWNAPQVLAAWVAIVGTLAGAVVGGLLQARLAARNLRVQADEAHAQREHAQATQDRQIREERFLRLRSERRDVYAKVLDACDEWVEAMRDLANLDITRNPDYGSQRVRTMAEARGVSAEGAKVLEMSQRMTRLTADVELIANDEVQAALRNLVLVLLEATKTAVGGQSPFASVQETRSALLRAMRKELVEGYPS